MYAPPGPFIYDYKPYSHYPSNMWKQDIGKADALGSPGDSSD